MEKTNDPIRTYYLLGFADGKDKDRKRQRHVPHMFKLSYVNGWYDGRLNRPSKYNQSTK